MVAMTPMSLRGKDDEAGGNAVGAILCSLATDVADPVQRLTAISASMKAGKGALSGLSQLQVSALSAVVMAPVLVNYLTGLHSYSRPAFNLVVSNVPGPPQTLYWNGARLAGSYPLSIPLNGQALNVTVTSYAGEMQFGLIGCRRTLPSLQKLLTGLEDGLAALEAALLPTERPTAAQEGSAAKPASSRPPAKKATAKKATAKKAAPAPATAKRTAVTKTAGKKTAATSVPPAPTTAGATA